MVLGVLLSWLGVVVVALIKGEPRSDDDRADARMRSGVGLVAGLLGIAGMVGVVVLSQQVTEPMHEAVERMTGTPARCAVAARLRQDWWKSPCGQARLWLFQPMRQPDGERSLRAGSSTSLGGDEMRNEPEETASEQTSIAVMTSPHTAISQHGMRPFALAPGDGTSVENPTGGVTTFKAVSDQSGGGLTVIEGVSAPGEGPPLHVHREQDEFIYTLDGTFRVRLGDDLIEALPGAFVFIPRNTPHTWQNVGEGLSRFIATLLPASVEFEEFFRRYADLPPGERGIEAFSRLAAETRAMEIFGPPLAQSDPR